MVEKYCRVRQVLKRLALRSNKAKRKSNPDLRGGSKQPKVLAYIFKVQELRTQFPNIPL